MIMFAPQGAIGSGTVQLLAEAGPFEIGYASLAIGGGLFIGMALLLWFSNKSRLDAELAGTQAVRQLQELNRKFEQRVEERTSQQGERFDELVQTADDLRRSNAELEQFAYVASHDLQEPLRMVTSYVQLLQRRYAGQLDAEADEFIEYAVDGAKRMQALIEDLLMYSRVERTALEPAEVDVERVLARTLDDRKMAVEEQGARVAHDPLPTIEADESQLALVLQNLISNALKFAGDEPPGVHVSAVRDDAECLFSVRDSGIGIEPAYHDRVFRIFQRLHGKAEYPGTGIGLAVCRCVVERHDGRIWVESNGTGGSTFKFALPVRSGVSMAA